MSKAVARTSEYLAGEINRCIDEGDKAFGKGLEKYREAGELLSQAKSQLNHGEWLPWLKENFAFSRFTANDYMNLAKNWDQVQMLGAPNISSISSIREAMRLLAQPEVIEMVRIDEPEVTEPDRPKVLSFASKSAASAVEIEETTIGIKFRDYDADAEGEKLSRELVDPEFHPFGEIVDRARKIYDRGGSVQFFVEEFENVLARETILVNDLISLLKEPTERLRRKYEEGK